NAFSKNHPKQHMRSCPECETDAKLTRTAGYRIRKQTVDADAAEENSNDSKETRKPGNQRLHRNGTVHLLFQTANVVDQNVRVDLSDGMARSRDDFLPVCPGSIANRKVAVEPRILCTGKIGRHQPAFGERGVLGILDHADHLLLARMIGGLSNSKTVSDRRTIRKEATRHGFVDDRDFI